jgi:hypothetical protein
MATLEDGSAARADTALSTARHQALAQEDEETQDCETEYMLAPTTLGTPTEAASIYRHEDGVDA